MKSGILAAEAIFNELSEQEIESQFKQSWLYDELFRSRNFGPIIHKLGTFWGGVFNTVDQNILGGKWPSTFRDNVTDHGSLGKARDFPEIIYDKPDGQISFDKLSSVFLSNTNHEEDQPCHL